MTDNNCDCDSESGNSPPDSNKRFYKERVIGQYVPDGFLITLSSETESLDENDHITLTPTVLHEYIHFVHNISTIGGFRSFLTSVLIWIAFRQTVGRDGRSCGSDGHPSADVAAGQQYLMLRRRLLGDGWIDSPQIPSSTTFLKWSLKDVTTKAHTHEVPGTVIHCECKIAYRGGGETKRTLDFGLIALFEGITSEIEGEHFLGAPPPNAIPYKLLRNFSDHLSKGISKPTYIKIATLSLLTGDPLKYLSEMLPLFDIFKKSGGMSEEDSLEKVEKLYLEMIETNIDSAFHDIDIVLNSLPKTPFANGFRYIGDRLKILLSRRLTEPYFDVHLFHSPENIGAIQDFMAGFPCIVIQERTGDIDTIERDIMFTWGLMEEEDLRVLQCALDFSLIHQKNSGLGFHETDFLEKVKIHHRCPLYTTCDLAMRVQRPDLCSQKPWQSSHWSGWPEEKTCAYGLGVLASIGAVSGAATEQAK